MTTALHIALSANERYMIGATVAASGVAVHAKPETELVFHLFTEDVKDETFAFFVSTLKRLHPNSEVIRHECDEKILAGLPYWAGSRMAAVRCHYATLMPDVDWCLYLDCDVLYLASVEEHFSYADGSAYACVVQEEYASTRDAESKWIAEHTDATERVPPEKYFNSGVMLFNFKKMREDGVPAKLIRFFKDHPDVPSPDQDALNATFGGCVKMIPPKFDRLQILLTDEKMKEHPVVHYVSGNPWLPKLSVVANGRFRLWHYFADKYVWQKDGESYRRCLSWRVLWLKRTLYLLLKCPFWGAVVAWSFQFLGMTSNAKTWRAQQTKYDISIRECDDLIDAKGNV